MIHVPKKVQGVAMDRVAQTSPPGPGITHSLVLPWCVGSRLVSSMRLPEPPALNYHLY